MASSNEGLKATIEIAKQIITLSTGVVTLTVTFWDKITPTVTTGHARAMPDTLKLAWAIYILADIFAVWTIMAVAGTLAAYDAKDNGMTPSATQTQVLNGRRTNINIPATGMVLCFLVAAGLTAATGVALR